MTSSGSPCMPTDTGRYDFVIVDTVLTLSNANDDCSIRSSILMGDYYGHNNIGLGFNNNLGTFGFSIYPNSVNDWLQLSEIFTQIRILDLTGKMVLGYKNSHKIEISDLSNGVYIIAVERSGRWEYRKFMKE